ncbi:uncharacterized protein DUF2617 [Micromonospora pisi]|uniref:Uncharacterized protein DUF2617 n=1 Tax=Micromonospora pisi TaxID=589240 RepID=A0A495JKM4_9ACTN|nr:DUF2617 family protein [Micromonospora pisi]RKR89118.1 uncharacterized protein DUF2617 [Micromonospora pisi]
MLVTLDTPYADTTAAELSLALGSPELPALHVLDLVHPDRPGVRLLLRLLGASHQVVLHRDPNVLRPALVETVACLPGRRPELPAALADPATGYRFTARVLRPDSAAMSARTAALRRELAEDPYALIGVFPGGPDAITALRLHRSDVRTRPDGVDEIGVGALGTGAIGAGEIGWRTWHAYPQSGELVETETVVGAA